MTLNIPPWLGSRLEDQPEVVCDNVVFRWFSRSDKWRDDYYRLDDTEYRRMNRDYDGTDLCLNGSDEPPKLFWNCLAGRMIVPIISVRGPPGPRGVASMGLVNVTGLPPVFENEADAVQVFLEIPPCKAWLYYLLLAGIDR